MALCASILEAIGRTPLVRLARATKDLSGIELFGKVESMNPGGSIKDRLALHLVRSAEARGLIRPGATLVEASAGNTGVGLAMVSAVLGYRCVIAVPRGTSPNKLAISRTLGAEIYECREDEDYVDAATRLAKERDGFRPDQFDNPDNPRAHGETTAKEILEDLDGRVDALVAACGTGGTLAGIGRALVAVNPRCQLIRVIPSGDSGPDSSRIEGVAPDGPPPHFDCPDAVTELVIPDEEAFAAAALLARTEGLFVGGSAGAAFAGARRAARGWPKGFRAVVILPDTGRNYVAATES